jgi:hypothetical protein
MTDDSPTPVEGLPAVLVAQATGARLREHLAAIAAASCGSLSCGSHNHFSAGRPLYSHVNRSAAKPALYTKSWIGNFYRRILITLSIFSFRA